MLSLEIPKEFSVILNLFSAISKPFSVFQAFSSSNHLVE
jgi:hypothetical protein